MLLLVHTENISVLLVSPLGLSHHAAIQICISSFSHTTLAAARGQKAGWEETAQVCFCAATESKRREGRVGRLLRSVPVLRLKALRAGATEGCFRLRMGLIILCLYV